MPSRRRPISSAHSGVVFPISAPRPSSARSHRTARLAGPSTFYASPAGGAGGGGVAGVETTTRHACADPLAWAPSRRPASATAFRERVPSTPATPPPPAPSPAAPPPPPPPPPAARHQPSLLRRRPARVSWRPASAVLRPRQRSSSAAGQPRPRARRACGGVSVGGRGGAERGG